MKYRTYCKLRSKYKTIRRVAFVAIAVIFIAWLVITILTFTQYHAATTAATCKPENTGEIKVDIFEPLDCELSTDLQEYTYHLCRQYGVEFELVMAIMFTESNFDPYAVSSTGDYGLMQINEINFAELSDKLGITDFTDPYQSIRSGIYILGQLASKYTDNARVLMAYNMGDYGSSVLWEQGVHSTEYTDKVIAKYKEYTEAQK